MTFRGRGETQKVMSLCTLEHVTHRSFHVPLVLEVVGSVCWSQAPPLLFSPSSPSASVARRSQAAAKHQ